jgi:hypothetical protein
LRQGRAFQSRSLQAEKRERRAWMSLSYQDLLLIIPFGLGEAFMLWALWNFLKASQKR